MVKKIYVLPIEDTQVYIHIISHNMQGKAHFVVPLLRRRHRDLQHDLMIRSGHVDPI